MKCRFYYRVTNYLGVYEDVVVYAQSETEGRSIIELTSRYPAKEIKYLGNELTL